MSGLFALVRACHLGPTVAVTFIAILLGVSAHLSGLLLLLVGITVLVGQLSIGWSNDWLDADNDAVSGRSDKPTTTGSISPRTLRLAALWAVAITVPVSLLVGRPGWWHLLLVASGWAYNAGLKKRAWSPVPYAVGFAALPLYVMGVAEVVAPLWLPLAGGLLGVAAHFANAAPDVVQDRKLGVLGLPQRIGARAALGVALVLLGAVGAVLLIEGQLRGARLLLGIVAVVVPVIAGAVLVARGQIGRSAFTLVMVAAVVDVALLVALV